MSLRPKLFRDPVHDIVAFDLDDPVQATLFDLVNSSELQRLRRIRQLGMSALVYHGAEHSRFAHCMGVCHLAQRVFAQLYPRHSDDAERLAVSAAALVHDVGHGPFSHVMERITRVHHEAYTLQALLDPTREAHQVLAGWGAEMPGRVAALLDHQGNASAAHSAIVSSQLDADRMDYILRDGLCTGVKIGVFDLARIVGMMEVDQDLLVVGDRAQEAVEGYLLARFHMYKQVYLHKATRSAERMLAAVFARTAWLHQQGFSFRWWPNADGLAALASGKVLTLGEHLELDDTDVWFALKQWMYEECELLAELARGLVERRLYKTIDLDSADPRGMDGVIADARDAVLKAGGHPEMHLLVDSSADSPYHPYQPGLRAQPIVLLDQRGRMRPIEKVSPIVQMLGEHTHETTRLCFPERYRAVVHRAAGPGSAPSLAIG